MRSPNSLACVCLLFAACAGQPATPASNYDCAASNEPGVQTRLTMIRRLLEDNHPYAALAHLDASGIRGPTADLLRADILRRTERQNDAATIYRGLTGGCLAGPAYHGLGLISGQRGRSGESLDYFRRARLAQPVDPKIRNDFGYALLLAGDYDAARIEFATALDLAPDNRKAAHNLVLLHLLSGDDERAQSLAERRQIPPEEMAELRSEAARLKTVPGEKK